MITPLSWCAALGRVKPELVGLPGKALAPDATRNVRFIVRAASYLHSTVLHWLTCISMYEQFDMQNLIRGCLEYNYLHYLCCIR